MEARTLLSLSTIGPDPLSSSSSTPVPAQSSGAGQSTPAAYDQLIGASAVRLAYKVDGGGSAVAVIDTGVNYHHQAFGGGFGPGNKVEGGYDIADNDPDPDNTANNPHGTAVASLIASADPANPGVAPGADIVALRVFGNNGQGSYENVAQALQYVLDHAGDQHITAVNLSISDNGNYSLDWFGQDGGIGQRINTLIGALKARNIPVIAAAGNSFNGQQGMGFTAILQDTISVTATDTADHLAGDAQRLGKTLGGANATDLAAPGVDVPAALVNGNAGFMPVSGTSFAAPIVSGAVVLLQQIYQGRFGSLPSVDDLNSWLQAGARTISDPATGITLGRLDIAASAALIPMPQATPSPSPAPPADPPTTTDPQPQTLPQPQPQPSTPPASDTSTPPPADNPAPPATAKPTPTPPADSAGSGIKVVINGQSAGTVNDVPRSSALEDFLSSLGEGGSISSATIWSNNVAGDPHQSASDSSVLAGADRAATFRAARVQRLSALQQARAERRGRLFGRRSARLGGHALASDAANV